MSITTPGPTGFLTALAALADPEDTYPDGWQPLPHQTWPDGNWRYALFLAGRGAGKTDSGAHYVDRYARENPGARIAIIAPTLGDARATCINGISGLLNANPSIQWVAHPDGTATWPNGSQARIFGASIPRDPDRLRGPQHHLVWGDELAAWPRLEETWEQMDFGLRLGPRPHGIFTTTPRPRPRIKRLITNPDVPVMRAATQDNPHLHQHVRDQLYDQYGGTVFGNQELLGELIEDEQDIVVPHQWLDACQNHRAVIHPNANTTQGTEAWQRAAETHPPGALTPITLGVDVGAGGDETVIIERRGQLAARVWTDHQPDTMRAVGLIIHALHETNATHVNIDVIGIGKGVVDRLQELRLDGTHQATVHGVNVARASTRPDRYPRLRDQLWWEIARGHTEARTWDLTAMPPTLLEQLSAPKYTLDSAGRIAVQSKDETRGVLGRSPDHADALILAYYTPPRRTSTIN